MEIKSETVQVVTYTLTLTEAEARHALEDPAELKAELRMALGETIEVKHNGRRVKPQAGKVAKRVKVAPKMVTCDICGKQTTARGIEIHKALAHFKTSKAGAAAAAE